MTEYTFTESQLELCRGLTDLQRKTVIGMVKGNLSQRKAYYAANGKAKSDEAADVSVCRMLKDDRVKAFHDALLSEAITDAVMSRREAMEVLTDIARSKISDIADFSTIEVTDSEGQLKKQSVWSFKDGDELTDKSARVISELSTGKDGVKLKTHSQVDAIKQLRALEGWDKPVKTELTGADGGPIVTESISDSELARRVAFMLTKGVEDAG